MFINYNLGSKDITIGDLQTKVNDGRYHVVRFTRSDTNSSLQVDDNPVQSKFPQGKRNIHQTLLKTTAVLGDASGLAPRESAQKLLNHYFDDEGDML